jgi:hypothetical protein
MRPGRIVLGRQHLNMMSRRQFAAEVEGVDLGTRGVAGQEVVDRVEDAQRHGYRSR